jgi:hypothetical protein
MVQYYIWGDFQLTLVLFLMIPIMVLIIKACASSTLVKAPKSYLLYPSHLVKGNYEVH